MIKVGIYLPIYGGWLQSRGSAKSQASETTLKRRKKNCPRTTM